jgi:hypothetical protein
MRPADAGEAVSAALSRDSAKGNRDLGMRPLRFGDHRS